MAKGPPAPPVSSSGPTPEQLWRAGVDKFRDASILRSRGRYDGCYYLCGYAVEFALKHRICKTLGWANYEAGGAFQSFRTHSLDVLAILSGRTDVLVNANYASWSVVQKWNPEMRYRPSSNTARRDADDLLAATKTIMRALR